MCETALTVAAKADRQYMTAVELSIAGGLLAGIILGAEFHK